MSYTLKLIFLFPWTLKNVCPLLCLMWGVSNGVGELTVMSLSYSIAERFAVWNKLVWCCLSLCPPHTPPSRALSSFPVLRNPFELLCFQFLVGMRGKDEAMAIGGHWSPTLDGADPENDASVLIKTAIRCCKALTGIDLSLCTQW